MFKQKANEKERFNPAQRPPEQLAAGTNQYEIEVNMLNHSTDDITIMGGGLRESSRQDSRSRDGAPQQNYTHQPTLSPAASWGHWQMTRIQTQSMCAIMTFQSTKNSIYHCSLTGAENS